MRWSKDKLTWKKIAANEDTVESSSTFFFGVHDAPKIHPFWRNIELQIVDVVFLDEALYARRGIGIRWKDQCKPLNILLEYSLKDIKFSAERRIGNEKRAFAGHCRLEKIRFCFNDPNPKVFPTRFTVMSATYERLPNYIIFSRNELGNFFPDPWRSIPKVATRLLIFAPSGQHRFLFFYTTTQNVAKNCFLRRSLVTCRAKWYMCTSQWDNAPQPKIFSPSRKRFLPGTNSWLHWCPKSYRSM